MQSKQTALRGIIPSIATTFAEDGSLDLAAQRLVVQFALRSGADGLVCFGLAGEVNKLTPTERKVLCETTIDEVAGRVPVLIGVGSEAIHTSIDLACHAAAQGADGVVIPPPITAHVDSAGLEQYFLAVAETVDITAIIQDAPEYLGVSVSPSSILRLAEARSNVRYVKIETGPEGTENWVKALSPRVGVLTGGAGLHLLHDLACGAVGNIPGTELTDLLVTIERHRAAGNHDKAQVLHRALLPYLVFSIQGIDHYNACTKEMLVRHGVLAHAGLRQPAPPLTSLSVSLLDSFAKELKQLRSR